MSERGTKTAERDYTNAFRRYQFLAFMMMGVVNPLLTPYMQSRGLSKAQVGGVQAFAWLAAAAAPFLWGMASDSARDRRTPLLAAILGATVSFGAFWFCGSFVAFAATMLLFAAFFRGIVPMSTALTFAWAEPRRVDYSRIRLFGAAGYVVALLILYVPLRARADLSPMFVCFAAFGLAAVVGLGAIPKLAGSGRRKFDWGALTLFTRRDFLVCLICTFFAQAAFASHYAFFSPYITDTLHVGRQYITLFWAFGSVIEVLMYLATGPLLRRFGTKWLLVIGMFGIAVRLGIYAAFPSVPVVFLAQGLHALTFAAVHASTVTFVNYSAPEKWRSGAQTLWEGITIGLGSAAGSLAGGYLAQAWDYRVLFAVMSLVAACSMIAFMIFGRAALQSRETEPAAAMPPDPSEE